MTEYISIQSSRDVIQHFGTKGMRWGQRKSKEFYTRKYINKGYGHLKKNAARVAAEHMAVNERNKRIWEEINSNKMKKTDKDLDALHKKGNSIVDLYRQRAKEAQKLSSDINKSSKGLVDATNRTRMNAKEANEMLSRIKKRNENFLKKYK